MGSHIVNGEFQSDKYPTCPPGKVPLSVKDTTAQDLLWEYAQRRRVVDAEFADDLETTLRSAGYRPPRPDEQDRLADAIDELVNHHLGPDNQLRIPRFRAMRVAACLNGLVCGWVNSAMAIRP